MAAPRFFLYRDNSLSKEEQVRKFWEVEVSAEYIDDNGKSTEDCEALKLSNSNIEKEGYHLQLPIPFKESTPLLPNSWRLMAYRQLISQRMSRKAMVSTSPTIVSPS